jgi:hypothetical protein
VQVGLREAAAGGSEPGGKGGRGCIARDRRAVADRDRGGGDPAEGATRWEGADERVDADGLGVVGEKVADGADHVGGDEQAPVGEPEHDLVPAGEANDPPLLHTGGEPSSDLDAMAGGDRIGVAAVPFHEDGDADHRRDGEGFVELGGVDGIHEEPALVEPDGSRSSPQELVRMGEPREAPGVVDSVRLQGAGW